MDPHLPESLSYDEVEFIVKRLTRKPIAYNPAFAEVGGSIEAGLFLSQAWHWTQGETVQDPQRDGWFYKKREEWERETGLDRYEQEDARKLLRARGLLEEEMRGMPAKLWYRVHIVNLIEGLRGGTLKRLPKKKRDFSVRNRKGRQKKEAGQSDRGEAGGGGATPLHADIVQTCMHNAVSTDSANMNAGGLQSDIYTESTTGNTYPADASGAAAGTDSPVEIVVEEDERGRPLSSRVEGGGADDDDDDGGADGGAPPPASPPPPDAPPSPPQGLESGGLEALADAVADRLMHRVAVTARKAAAEEGARTREYVEHSALPKAARVATAETIETLRRNGVQLAPKRARRVDVGRGAGGPADSPNLFPLDNKEFAEICVAMLVTQGRGFDRTIEQLMTPEGGGLTPEEAPAVRQLAEAMYREQHSEEVSSVRAAT